MKIKSILLLSLTLSFSSFGQLGKLKDKLNTDPKEAQKKKIEQLEPVRDYTSWTSSAISDIKKGEDFSEDGSYFNLDTFNYYKAYYNKVDGKSEYYNEKFREIEEFYVNELPKVKEKLLMENKQLLTDTEWLTASNRSQPGFAEKSPEPWIVNKNVDKIAKQREVKIKTFLAASPDDQQILENERILKTREDELRNYVESGECKRDNEKRAQDKADKVMPPKALRTDAKISGGITDHYSTYNSITVKRVIVQEKDYRVQKDKYGNILSKTQNCYVIIETEGKCFLCYGEVFCNYMGSDVYSGVMFKELGREEMNCANVNK